MHRSKIVKNYQKFICCLIFTLLICCIPNLSLAQVPNKAPVVLDGQVLFEVGDFGIFSARERAGKINQALIDTVRANKEITIEVVELDNQATIRDSANQRHLLTITQADIISAATPYRQAIQWENALKEALQKAQQERTAIYRSKALFATLGTIFLAIALHLGLRFIGRFSTKKISNLLQAQPRLRSWNKFLIRWEKLTILSLQILVWLSCFFYAINLFPQSRNWLYWLFYWLNSPSISLGEKSYSPLAIVFLLSLTVVVWLIVRFLTNSFKYYVLRQIGAEQEIQEIIATFIQYILTFLALIILWQSWGLDLGALAITASVLGVGIGFGLQNIANNFLSGLIITGWY